MDLTCEMPIAGAMFQTVVASTDCAIAERVNQAYAALQAPGSGFAQITTIILTIYVAILGYRLVLGYAGLSLAELIPHFVKIGVVVALITSWPNYQTLVFNLLFNGPQELAAVVTATPASGGADRGDVLDGLQSSYDRITAVATVAWSQHAPADAKLPRPADRFATAAPDAAPGGLLPTTANQLGASQFTSLLLWLSAFVMVAASIGALLVLRIILALVLLVGPFFILAGLFVGTRGLLEGWLRIAVRYAIAPLFVTLGSAGLIIVLAPFLTQLEQTPEQPEASIALAIALIIAVFAAVLTQAAKLSGGIARGIRLPRGRTAAPSEPQTLAPALTSREAPFLALPSRAEMLAHAIDRSTANASSRERTIVMPTAGNDRLITTGSSARDSTADISGRLGQTYRRTAVVQQRTPGI